MGSSKIEAEIILKMSNIVGSENVSNSIFEKIKQSVDPHPYGLKFSTLPYVVVLPKNNEEISEIFKYANCEKISVFVRGSGTQLAGSSRPHKHGIMINTAKMNNFFIDEEFGFFESGPGVRVDDAGKMLSDRGFFLPIWPGSRVIASMGGVISNNTAGHIVDAAMGRIADYVLGLEVVLPTGEIIETGTMGMRKPAGMDLTKMFVGGDGIMGFITNIRMRLIPALKQSYGIAIFKDLKPIANGVKRMYTEKVSPPIFMEFMDHNVSKIAFEIKEMASPPGPVIFFVATGEDQEFADKKMEKIMKIFVDEKPIEARAIKNLSEWKKLWVAREVIAPYLMNKLQGKLIAVELVANLKYLHEAMQEGRNFHKDIPHLKDLTNYYFGHIGALTMHPTYVLPPDWSDEVMHQVTDEKFKKEMEFNLKYGTAGGEWGSFSKRTPFFIKRYGAKSYEICENMKRVFDPNNILNPGIIEGKR